MSVPLIIAAVVAINLLTFFLYWYDKRLARHRGWRIPEATLLGSALLGGSPAAYLAMRHFRHKTSKPGFRMRYWCIVLLQAGAAVKFIVWPMLS